MLKQITETIQANNQDYQLLSHKELNSNEHAVLCKHKQQRKYVTWIYTSSGLVSGNYIEDHFNKLTDAELYQTAVQDYNKRK